MAKLTIDKFVMDEVIFGRCDHQVVISAISDAGGGYWELEIDGVDVPKKDRVTAIVDVQQNRLGERLTKMQFE